MKIEIDNLKNKPEYLQEVITLGDRNSNMLGFFPKKAFEEAARRGKILIATIENKKCIGYLLFRKVKSRQSISITHLCIDETYRKKGVGSKLVKHLLTITGDWRGIELYCRRDFKTANEFWKNIGFQYITEKTGRGKDKEPLSCYWYPQPGHKSLVEYSNKKAIEEKTYNAVIDQNVFIDIFNGENQILRGNLLLEDVVFSITPELRNEIQRDDDDKRRREMLNFSREFPEINARFENIGKIQSYLDYFFNPNNSQQDISDIKHLALAISSNADFFITNDEKIHRKLKRPVLQEFGLLITNPENLIVHFDEIINNSSYKIQRMSGTTFNISRIPGKDIDYLIDIFHQSKNLNKSSFRHLLNSYLSDPQKYKAIVIRGNEDNPLGLVVFQYCSDQILEIPLICAIKNTLSPAFESNLVFQIIKESQGVNYSVIRIMEQNISNSILKGLLENGFEKINNDWVKINYNGQIKLEEIDNLLSSYKKGYTKKLIQIIELTINEINVENNVNNIIYLEKKLWPLKIIENSVDNFIVPIRPPYAMDLFDEELGEQTLFGANPLSMLKMQNVYYKSANKKYPSAPSRVLWYISNPKNNGFQGTMAIRACSYVEEAILDFPKEIFKKFNKLGVYNWNNVLSIVDYDQTKKIFAFRFSRTELFKNPVGLDEYKIISGYKNAPCTPQQISNEVFHKIYKKGFTL